MRSKEQSVEYKRHNNRSDTLSPMFQQKDDNAGDIGYEQISSVKNNRKFFAQNESRESGILASKNKKENKAARQLSIISDSSWSAPSDNSMHSTLSTSPPTSRIDMDTVNNKETVQSSNALNQWGNMITENERRHSDDTKKKDKNFMEKSNKNVALSVKKLSAKPTGKRDDKKYETEKRQSLSANRTKNTAGLLTDDFETLSVISESSTNKSLPIQSQTLGSKLFSSLPSKKSLSNSQLANEIVSEPEINNNKKPKFIKNRGKTKIEAKDKKQARKQSKYDLIEDDARDIVDDAVDRAIRLFFGKKPSSKKERLSKHKSEPQLGTLSNWQKPDSNNAADGGDGRPTNPGEIIKMSDKDFELESTQLYQRRKSSIPREPISPLKQEKKPTNALAVNPKSRSSVFDNYTNNTKKKSLKPSIYSSLPNVSNLQQKTWKIFESPDVDASHVAPAVLVPKDEYTRAAVAQKPVTSQENNGYVSDSDQSTIVRLQQTSKQIKRFSNDAKNVLKRTVNPPTLTKGNVTRVLFTSDSNSETALFSPLISELIPPTNVRKPISVITSSPNFVLGRNSSTSDSSNKSLSIHLQTNDKQFNIANSSSSMTSLCDLPSPRISPLNNTTTLTQSSTDVHVSPCNNHVGSSIGNGQKFIVAETNGAKLYGTRSDIKLAKCDVLNMYVFNQPGVNNTGSTMIDTVLATLDDETEKATECNAETKREYEKQIESSLIQNKQTQTLYDSKKQIKIKPQLKLKPEIYDKQGQVYRETIYVLPGKSELSNASDIHLSDAGVQTDAESDELQTDAINAHTISSPVIVKDTLISSKSNCIATKNIKLESNNKYPEVALKVHIPPVDRIALLNKNKETKRNYDDNVETTIVEEKEQKYTVEIKEEVEFQVQRTQTGNDYNTGASSMEDIHLKSKSSPVSSPQPNKTDHKKQIPQSKIADMFNSKRLINSTVPRANILANKKNKSPSNSYITKHTIYLSDSNDNQSDGDNHDWTDTVNKTSQSAQQLLLSNQFTSQPELHKHNRPIATPSFPSSFKQKSSVYNEPECHLNSFKKENSHINTRPFPISSAVYANNDSELQTSLNRTQTCSLKHVKEADKNNVIHNENGRKVPSGNNSLSAAETLPNFSLSCERNIEQHHCSFMKQNDEERQVVYSMKQSSEGDVIASSFNSSKTSHNESHSPPEAMNDCSYMNFDPFSSQRKLSGRPRLKQAEIKIQTAITENNERENCYNNRVVKPNDDDEIPKYNTTTNSSTYPASLADNKSMSRTNQDLFSRYGFTNTASTRF